jgi:hypothetical protein
MGAPISSIMSEIYSHYLEHNHVIDILKRHKIDGYFQ